MAESTDQKTAAFIAKARAIHGDHYDYSETQFAGAKAKVTIICPKHGSFRQIARFHIRKSRPCGCLRCGQLRRSTNLLKTSAENFIKKAKAIHGDRYDYSEAVFRGAMSKVRIICPEHGPFMQTAHTHTNRKLHCGCPRCGQLRSGPTPNALAAKLFVKRSRKAHGDKYDYAKTRYEGAHTKVCIICPQHGEFWQSPNVHLKGQGCWSCGVSERALTRRKNAGRVFVRKARKVHSYKFAYSAVQYVSVNTKVSIVCRKHGPFLQSPHSHLRGSGCPSCGIASAAKTRSKAAKTTSKSR